MHSHAHALTHIQDSHLDPVKLAIFSYRHTQHSLHLNLALDNPLSLHSTLLESTSTTIYVIKLRLASYEWFLSQLEDFTNRCSQKNPHLYIYTSSTILKTLVLFLFVLIKQKIIGISKYFVKFVFITSANQMFHSESMKFDGIKNG